MTPTSTCSLIDLVLGRFISEANKKDTLKHLSRIPEIDAQAEPLRNCLSFFPAGYEKSLADWEKEFLVVKEALSEEIEFPATADISLIWLQFMLVRALQPETVVETGVWIGGSSFTLLSALDQNKKGNLISIDYPPFRKRNRVGIGRLVPESLYDRWELHLGPAKSLLKKITKPGSVDLFIHDSDHTYANMTAEFERAWELVKPGGFLVSDDSSLNDSVLDFVEKKGCDYKFLEREKGGTIAIMSRS